MINCVCHKRHKNKKSTSLHAAFNVVFGNVYFALLIFNIHGRKMRFSASSQKSVSAKSIFPRSGVIHFPKAGLAFSC